MQEILEICGELVFRRTCSTLTDYEYTVIEQDIQDETISHLLFFQSSISKPVFITRFSTILLHVVCHQLEKRGWGLCDAEKGPRPPPGGLKWQCGVP